MNLFLVTFKGQPGVTHSHALTTPTNTCSQMETHPSHLSECGNEPVAYASVKKNE